jgi:hypothetical protein
MNTKHFTALALVAAVSGCAAAPVENTSSVQGTTEALTTQECATQRDSCFSANPIFGFFTCPVQSGQCLATASNGLPAQVTSAISAVNGCASIEATCLGKATTPSATLACTENAASCVGEVVGASLPKVVTGTAACVTSSVECVRAAKSASDLAGCGETLQSCAVGQAVSVLPPAVGQVVTSVDGCLGSLRTCTEAAATPAALTTCSEAEVQCIANALGVPAPSDLGAEAIKCAENGAQCTLDASSVADIQDCTASLIACNGTVAKAALTCDQKWTRCLAQNPFGFLQCAFDLATCQ